MTSEEVEQLKSYLQTDMLWSELKRLFKTNSWATDSKLVSLLEMPLMRLCAGYLYLEKRRGYALDNVGKTDFLIHIHVKFFPSYCGKNIDLRMYENNMPRTIFGPTFIGHLL